MSVLSCRERENVMREPIIVPKSLMPKPQPYRNCECMKQPVDLVTKKGTLIWLKKTGDRIEKGEVVCEGEVDKKTVEITAPCSGILTEQIIGDEFVFRAGDVLGYLETE